MTDLIAKLEEAGGPSIALDAEICWTLERARATTAFWRGAMGLPKPLPDEFSRLPRGLGMASLEAGSPNYTASVDAALALASRLGLDVPQLLNDALEGPGGLWARGWRSDRPLTPQIALALCAAILRASEEK